MWTIHGTLLMSSRSVLNVVVVGASRGIGEAVAQHLSVAGHRVVTVSRSECVVGEWVQADVSTQAGIDAVRHHVANQPIDALLYMGGTWEQGAFTQEYDFSSCSSEDIRQVIAVNLTAPILLSQALFENLAQSENSRIVLMGSVSGLENTGSVEVAYTASKLGLRGAAQALAIATRKANIGITVINPDNVATTEVQNDINTGVFASQVAIPMSDILNTIDYLLNISVDTVPVEITLAQRNPSE